MTNQEIQALYRANLGHSEVAALRGVFDAGYRLGFSDSANPKSPAKIVPAPKVLAPLPPSPPSASAPTVQTVSGVGDASAGAPMAGVSPLVPKISTL